MGENMKRRDTEMTVRSGIVRWLACITISAATCTTTGDSNQALQARIGRVIGGLHVRQSAGELVPAERWKLEARMSHYRVPAVSIAVIHDGKIQWARAYGMAVQGGNKTVSDKTLFQAASISKALTAFAILRVVDQGLLDLNAPVNRYLRTWKLPESDAGSSDSVTTALVMAHMAGLSRFNFPGYAPGSPIPTLTQILDGVAPANTPPVRIAQPPGSTWTYSNGGYLVLQKVLQDATGEGFPSLMNTLVLEPLGMRHSTFQQPLPAALETSAAVGHHEDGEPLPGRWRIHPEFAAAGLWTTASDLARFALAVHTAANQLPGALLSAESAAALTTQRFINFSLGLLVRRNGDNIWFTHNGGNEGYRALMYAYLTAAEGAVVMMNADTGLALASEIINAVALEYGWPGFIPEEFW